MTRGDYFSDYYGLLFDCPMNEEQCSCPFHEIRQIESFPERLKYFRSLTQEAKAFLIGQHIKCINQRENSIGLASEN